MTPDASSAQRYGLAAALAAYVAWGLMPIYFKWIGSVNPWEIIMHRVIWAIPILLLFLAFRDGRALWSKLRLSRRQLGWLCVSGLLIGANWLIFVWAVVNDQVLSTSLGYFINPLMNVAFGFLFLGERMTPWQKWGVGIAAFGTAFLAIYLGQPPWISLALALSFALYGLVRKRLDVGPMTGLLWENLLLLAPALAYLAWSAGNDTLDFLHGPPRIDVLLVLSGLTTVLPLIWFNMAAQRLTLTTIGFIQYLAPSMTFSLAVFLWGEPFTLGHAVAFGCIWFALVLVTTETFRHRRRQARALSS
ncbi:MAG: EamA family transporter RarD [Xanthomonadales bacterium]|jgi:chloramphenicol-sensitive protein RarD|nr:EamA family transporter RarD [Xanthomonadales bacterium]